MYALQDLEAAASRVREVLRSLPHLQRAYQEGRGMHVMGIRSEDQHRPLHDDRMDVLAMIMENGGYYDRMHSVEPDWTRDQEDLRLPADLSRDEELRAIRLHRLGQIVEMFVKILKWDNKKLSNHLLPDNVDPSANDSDQYTLIRILFVYPQS